MTLWEALGFMRISLAINAKGLWRGKRHSLNLECLFYAVLAIDAEKCVTKYCIVYLAWFFVCTGVLSFVRVLPQLQLSNEDSSTLP